MRGLADMKKDIRELLDAAMKKRRAAVSKGDKAAAKYLAGEIDAYRNCIALLNN